MKSIVEKVASRYLGRPKRAMVGNSFDPFEFHIKRVGDDRYLLELSSKGTVSGDVQHCSDTLRFVSQDIHEMSGLFFAMGLRTGYRIISRSEPFFKTEGRIECRLIADFVFPNIDARAVFEEAMRPLGVASLTLDL